MTGRQGESEHGPAPSFTVPDERIVSVEHPCIVKKFEKGFKSLGNEPHLKHVSHGHPLESYSRMGADYFQVIEHHVGDGLKKVNEHQKVLIEPVAGVSLRPNDPLAKRLCSTGVDTRNLLIRVTVPKRTGRKRKRGSDDPFTLLAEPESRNDSIDAHNLLRRMRDNEDTYRIEPVGMIRETHRFRNLPDFQLRGEDMVVARQLRDHALVPSYDRLRRFRVDTEPGSRDPAAFPPPPMLAPNDQPYRYRYQQEASVKFTFDEHGTPIAENHSRAPRRVLEWIANDAPEVPQAAPPDWNYRRDASVSVVRCVDDMIKILNDRPIVTRRVLANLLPQYSESIIKEATQWVGYSFHAGPWRDSIIKFGVDPRKDPKYRIYQTIMFQIDRELVKSANQNQQWARTMRYHAEAEAHIFDGEHITVNGKIWQLCDITEPMLRKKLDSIELRSECEVQQWGWFHTGGLAKVRVIMRDMMRYLFTDATSMPMDDYRFLLALPENHADRNNESNVDRTVHKHLSELIASWGSVSKAGNANRRLRGKMTETEDGVDAGAEEGGTPRDGGDEGDVEMGDEDEDRDERDDDEDGAEDN